MTYLEQATIWRCLLQDEPITGGDELTTNLEQATIWRCLLQHEPFAGGDELPQQLTLLAHPASTLQASLQRRLALSHLSTVTQ